MEKECELRVKVSLNEEKIRYLLEDIEILKEKLNTVEDKLIEVITSATIDIVQSVE